MPTSLAAARLPGPLGNRPLTWPAYLARLPGPAYLARLPGPLTWPAYLARLPGPLTWPAYLARLPGPLTWARLPGSCVTARFTWPPG